MQMFHVPFLTAALPYQRAEAGKTKSVILMIMMKKKKHIVWQVKTFTLVKT